MTDVASLPTGRGDGPRSMDKINPDLSSLSVRFYEKFSVADDGCWNWSAFKLPDGYGKIGHLSGVLLAHRASWMIHRGKIPYGMCVCHSCDNTSCVNPDHLWLGTQSDNIKDCVAKGRRNPAPQGGELNSAAKLGECDVIDIRRRYATGDVKQRELAREYGVSPPTISMMVRMSTWRTVSAK